MKKTMIAFITLAFTLTVAAPALAEDPVPAAAQAQNTEAKNLRKEIVKLKYVRAQDVRPLLYTFISRDGHLQDNPNMPHIMTVSDTPENVEKILAAIREIDVKPPDILYTVQLVLGSEADATPGADLRNDPVVKELGKLLRYKGYTLLDSTLLRAVNRENAEVKFGPKAEFEFVLRPEVAGDAKAPTIKTTVRLRQTVVRDIKSPKADGTDVEARSTSNITLIESTLNIKSGERTVVGVSKLDGGDKGLILIISAR